MGIEYTLVNETKKERIAFSNLNGNKKRELAGNAAQSAIVTWYLLNNQGDEIQFVSDGGVDWPFKSGSRDGSLEYQDRTDELLADLVENKILKDNGFLYVDGDEPEKVYVKDFINVWTKC